MATSPLMLLESLALRRVVRVLAVDRREYCGVVNTIAAEGGEGYYNVTFQTGKTVCVYLPL